MALYCSKTSVIIIKMNNLKNNGDFYCLNCLNLLRTNNKLESHKKVCKNKNSCHFVMPSKDAQILVFNQSQKSDKTPSIIYADLES